MKSVEQIFTDIVRREGGYVNHEDDRGGATNHGVSLRYARGVGLDLDGDGDTDKDDIKLVTPDKAVELYKEDFYYGPRIHKLPKLLHAFLADFAVHSGPPRAIMTLQKTLNLARQFFDYGKLSEDGVMGPKTRQAAEMAHASMGDFLLKALVEEREKYLKRIVKNDPSQAVFLDGWMNRIDEFRV